MFVDGSESMAYGSQDWNKFDYARWCAAALAHLVLQARDTAGLIVFDRDWRSKVPPGNGALQLKDILTTLEQADPGGPTDIGSVLEWVAPKLKKKGIIVILSDFFDEPERIISGLRRLVHAGHEPVLLQIVDPREIDFEFDSQLKLEGLEQSGMQKVDPRAIRSAYCEEFEAHTRALSKAAAALGLDYVRLSTGEPIDAGLMAYLAGRMARVRSGRRV
jgi:uncharacterized protein (DUF58 family)